MTKIGLLSDTHGYLDLSVLNHFEHCDEVWHAGDIGSEEVAEELEKFKRFRAVHGNIDWTSIRKRYPEHLRFFCEKTDVLLTHIGGYPGHYDRKVHEILKNNPPKIFICGHSHILRVIYDKKFSLLHINPGAAGRFGQQRVRTLVRFAINGEEIKEMEVIEF